MSARRATRPSNRSNTPDTSSTKPPKWTHPSRTPSPSDDHQVPTVVMRLGRTCRRMSRRASGSISFPEAISHVLGITFMARRKVAGATKVSIEQVLGAQAPKSRERPIPRPPDRVGRAVGENRAPQLRALRQTVEACRIETQRIGLHCPDGRQHEGRRRVSVVPPPIGHAQSDGPDLDAVVLPSVGPCGVNATPESSTRSTPPAPSVPHRAAAVTRRRCRATAHRSPETRTRCRARPRGSCPRTDTSPDNGARSPGPAGWARVEPRQSVSS